MSMSDYLENKLIDHLFRDTTFAKPTTLHIALLTTAAVDSDTGTQIYSGSGGTGVEVSGGSYARVAYNPSASANWEATQGGVSGASSGTGGLTSNNTTITFPTATGNWGTIVGIAILDASTNGNALYFGTLSVNKTVTSGDVFQFSENQLSITFA